MVQVTKLCIPKLIPIDHKNTTAAPGHCHLSVSSPAHSLAPFRLWYLICQLMIKALFLKQFKAKLVQAHLRDSMSLERKQIASASTPCYPVVSICQIYLLEE